MVNIQKNISLAPRTTFCIGGPAKYFVAVNNEKELIEVLEFAEGNHLDFFILGGGSNILVNDKGFDGLVISIRDVKLEIKGTAVECGAGVALAKIVALSMKNGLVGMEWAAGIPGTVGGAVRGNAAAFQGSMADVVESVKVLEIQNSSFQAKNYNKQDCLFQYRSSIFKKSPRLIILSVALNLQKGNQNEIREKVEAIIKKRSANQPLGMKSAGSFFVNPIVADEKLREEFERDTGMKSMGQKIPAVWLIDQAGLKGKKIGGAMISEKHANFIVNTGNATAEDVIILTSLIKQKVRNKFKVQLQEEVCYVGF